MKRILVTYLVITILMVGICFFIFEIPGQAGYGMRTSFVADTGSAISENGDSEIPEESDDLLPDDLDSILVDTKTVPLDTIPNSITVLVNRDYLLPSSYVPAKLVVPKIRFSFEYMDDKRLMRKEAARALEKMFRDAEKKKNIILVGVSGYRSYQRQREIYLRNVALRGRSATDTESATPGSSEHQTGLTIDISSASVGYSLVQAFADSREGRWVAKNAHKYGYIIRYPAKKTKITGYHFEPWHIRYVGTTVATYLYENNLTMEEYYGVYNKKKN